MISGASGGTFATQWSYDAAGRPVWQKYPANNAGGIGEQVNYAYTNQGLLDTVIGTTTYVGDTQWNVRGQVGERRLGSAAGVVRQLYAYTAAENFRLVTLKAGNASPYTNLQNITYTYDDNGNVQTISDAAAYGGSQTQSFSYDALNRLLTAQATGGSNGAYAQRSYVYSNAGNITSFEAAALTYTDASHKHAVTHVGSVQKYWYDANGNATRRINGAQDITLNYDVENRLTGMSGGVTASYIYDGDGARVKETSGGVTTIYIGAYFEWTGSTSTMKSYYYAGATRVAMRTGTSTGTVNYLLGDHLGSQALTLTSAGARLNTNTELRYMPYGAARYTAGATPTSYNFTGQRKDSGSGLLFYNARWYDPVIGRFLAADTIVPEPGNPGSLNRYSYVLNNPTKYIDLTGHSECEMAEDCYASKPAKPRKPLIQEIIRQIYKGAYKHYLPKKLIDNYVDEGGPLQLTAQEAIDTNPLLKVQDSKGFPQALTFLKQNGGGSVHIKTTGPAVSLTNGTLGNFSVNYEGDVTLNSDGSWSFAGQASFYDYWDFDPKPEGSGRSKVGELKVRITAAILPGKPFDIASDPLCVSQTSDDVYVSFPDYPDYTPAPVIDPWTQRLAPLLNEILR